MRSRAPARWSSKHGEINSKGKIKHAVTSARIYVNDVQIFKPKHFNKKVHHLEAQVDLNEKNTLRVKLRGKKGRFLSISILQDVPGPVIHTFSAEPDVVGPGESATLLWETENATSCSMDQDIGQMDPNGSILVSPLETTQYTLTATGPAGTTEASVTVTVTGAVPVVTISAFPSEISQGESAVLTWDSSYGDQAYMNNGIGEVDLSGSMTITPDHTTPFTITVTERGGHGIGPGRGAGPGGAGTLARGLFWPQLPGSDT